MKYIFIISSLFLITTLNAQKYNYSIGLNFQPFYYESYNKIDWNNRPYSYPDNPTSFNGYAIGLVFTKPLNNWFSFGTEFSYSQQNQKHISSNFSGGGGVNSPFNININSDFTYLKLPIFAHFQYQLGYESTFYLSLSSGIQVSYLLDYYSVETVYEVDRLTYTINYDFYTAKYIDGKDNEEYYFWEKQGDKYGYKHVVNNNPINTYKNWNWGILSEISIKKIFFSKYILSIGIRYEYDFTDSEKNPSLIDFHRYYYGNKPKTHNIRKGINFTFNYLIN